MSALQFRDEGERRAWDLYVAGALSCEYVNRGEAIKCADTLVLNRRERSFDLEQEKVKKKPCLSG